MFSQLGIATPKGTIKEEEGERQKEKKKSKRVSHP
jgi:hypothetical protein